jgi:hypothetical protein
MSPLSAPVLGGAALLTAPALWRSVTDAMSLQAALGRYLLAVLLCWVALEVVVTMVGRPVSPSPEAVADQDEPETITR